MVSVVSYTYASVADNRPGFPLTRPDFDTSGAVRSKSNPSPKRGGVRSSKAAPATGDREGVRVIFGRGSYEYTQLAGVSLGSWQSAASAAGLEAWQYYQGGMAWRRARAYGCVAVVPVSVYTLVSGDHYWEGVSELG